MAQSIYLVAYYAFQAYSWIIIFYILSSWIPPLRESKVGLWAGKLVEPYLGIFRRFIPPIGMIDISPILAILVYNFLGMAALQGLASLLQLV